MRHQLIMWCLIFVCLSGSFLLTRSEPNATNFETTFLPYDSRLMASVGNGFLATAVYSDTIYVSGVFNGRGTSAPSHRARIPSTAAIVVEVGAREEDANETFSLNVRDGVFVYKFGSRNFSLEQRVYAHRVKTNLIVNEISYKNSGPSPVRVGLSRVKGAASKDIDLKPYELALHESGEETSGRREASRLPNDYKAVQGETKETEEPDSPKVGVAVVWTQVPDYLEAGASSGTETRYFITSVSTSLNSQDFLRDAYNAWAEASQQPEELLVGHVAAWRQLWNQGRVEVEGNLDLAQAIYSGLYYVLSSLRPSWPRGLSPGSLASDGYDGHTFWDQETWMYPPLLMLFPDFARSCLTYRFDRLDAAKKNAEEHHFRGAMFPWESAFTGSEVCPGDIYADYEQHITGDIAFAVKQYWWATSDQRWLDHNASTLIYASAEFWASRAMYNASLDAYVIYDVMPPDEDAEVVNNSAYTNVVAKLNLEFACKVLSEVPSNWSTIAAKMFVPFDAQQQFHPEYDGYSLSTQVKQADVILLGFPLGYNMTPEVRTNDLRIYEPRTNPRGPAMTKAMFAVNWLEVGREDKATEAFKRGFANAQAPFKVWTETADGGGVVNFITGAGGFLQSVIFGYGGLRLRENELRFRPRLPPETTSLSLIGVNYLGNSIDFIISADKSKILVTSRGQSSHVLQATVTASHAHFRLDVGQVVSVDNTEVAIEPLEDLSLLA